MARLPRLKAAGFPHHVIQRGNDRRPIFVDDADREHYLACLAAVTAPLGLSLHAYVLMPNHAHLLVTPQAAGDVGRAIQALGRRYVRWFNDRHRRSGPLFEGRYRATVVEAERYLLACMRYIELNPVRAQLCQLPLEFRWSSYRHHVGIATDPVVTDHPVYWELGNTPFDRQAAYVRLFTFPTEAAELDLIRRSTHGGWLLGSSAKVAGLSPDRRPLAGRPGRPRKHSVPI